MLLSWRIALRWFDSFNMNAEFFSLIMFFVSFLESRPLPFFLSYLSLLVLPEMFQFYLPIFLLSFVFILASYFNLQ